MNKYLAHVFLLALATLSASVTLAQPATLDKIIAIVDEEVILESELQERFENVMAQFQGRSLPAGLTPEVVRQQVLDQLITETLQLQLAYRNGMRMDDNTLNQAMAQIAQDNGMDFETFRGALEAQGVYNQTRDQISREMIINQFQNRAVNRRINITRQEVDNYLRSESGAAAIAPEYRVAHILISGSDNVATQEGRRFELGQLLYERINDGEDIIQLAQSGSISGLPVSGGDLGWNKPENLPSLFANVVPSLRPGEVNEPFISPNGVHVVQLLEVRGGTSLEIRETRLRHIMIAPNEVRTEEQAEALIHELRQRIVDGEDFGSIARQNTDDVSSIVSGGDLDWVSEGQLPEGYEAFVDSLEVGELSEPYRSESGWHIAQVMERRIRDVTEENTRYRAEQILRNRKFEMELENWLSELRDTTYIKVLAEEQ